MTDDELEALDIDARIDARLDRLGEQIRQVVAERDVLAAEVERLRGAIGIAVTICGNARRAVSSGQFHDKEVGRKIEEIERGLFTALQEPPA